MADLGVRLGPQPVSDRGVDAAAAGTTGECSQGKRERGYISSKKTGAGINVSFALEYE